MSLSRNSPLSQKNKKGGTRNNNFRESKKYNIVIIGTYYSYQASTFSRGDDRPPATRARRSVETNIM